MEPSLSDIIEISKQEKTQEVLEKLQKMLSPEKLAALTLYCAQAYVKLLHDLEIPVDVYEQLQDEIKKMYHLASYIILKLDE